VQFVERYEADVRSKPARAKELQKLLHVAETGTSPQVGGRWVEGCWGARGQPAPRVGVHRLWRQRCPAAVPALHCHAPGQPHPKAPRPNPAASPLPAHHTPAPTCPPTTLPPTTCCPQAREAKDLAAAEQHFQALGWRDEGPEGSVASDELLGALLRRAAAFKEARDKERERAHGGAVSEAQLAFSWDAPPFRCGLRAVRAGWVGPARQPRGAFRCMWCDADQLQRQRPSEAACGGIPPPLPAARTASHPAWPGRWRGRGRLAQLVAGTARSPGAAPGWWRGPCLPRTATSCCTACGCWRACPPPTWRGWRA
jgi:hypothetical protein